MEMFDAVRFRYRMPEGVYGTDFQTDDLACECEFYKISPKDRMLSWYKSSELKDRKLESEAQWNENSR